MRSLLKGNGGRMRDNKYSTENIVIYIFGFVVVIWFTLLIAPAAEKGLVNVLVSISEILNNPFKITLCEDSLKTVLILVMIYGVALGVYLSTESNYRRREEHGSAKWGNARQANKKYINKDKY